MSPPYIFRIDEISQNPRAPSLATNYGHWIPSTQPGVNVPVGGGASGAWWICNGQSIQPAPDNALPYGSRPYQTFSVFYSDGFGFWIMRGDAIRPNQEEAWKPLCFDHDENDWSSYLTNAGPHQTLRFVRNGQMWPYMLLPNVYHCRPAPASQTYGGLTGDLAIFLGLMALSMDQLYVSQHLPARFTGGAWKEHRLTHGRVHQRGVVVYIYTCPTSWAATYGSSTAKDLHDYEKGVHEKYFH